MTTTLHWTTSKTKCDWYWKGSKWSSWRDQTWMRMADSMCFYWSWLVHQVDIKQESVASAFKHVQTSLAALARQLFSGYITVTPRQNKDLENHFQKLDKDRSGSVTLATSCHLGRMDTAQIRDLEIDPEISNKTWRSPYKNHTFWWFQIGAILLKSYPQRIWWDWLQAWPNHYLHTRRKFVLLHRFQQGSRFPSNFCLCPSTQLLYFVDLCWSLLIGHHCQNNGHVAMSDAEYDIAKDLGGTPRSSLSLQRTRLARCKPWQEHQPLGSRIHLQNLTDRSRVQDMLRNNKMQSSTFDPKLGTSETINFLDDLRWS